MLNPTDTHRTFPSIAEKFLNINGLNIAYSDRGSNQTVLCLHALGHSSKDFASLYDLPLNEFRIIALDFPGHGRSSSSTIPASSGFYYSVTNQFIQLLGLQNIIIVGNSIGGAVALRLAQNNPHIKILALSNPAGLDKRGFIAPVFLTFMIRFFKKGVSNKSYFQRLFNIYYSFILTTDHATARKTEIVKDAYNLAPLLVEGWTSFKSDEEDLRSAVKNIHCPVLITWAMKDKFVQFSRNKKAISEFTQVTLIQYPIGHTPYVEIPERFKRDFIAFVTEALTKPSETGNEFILPRQ